MSVYIKGVEMPTDKNDILIFAIRSDGRVEDVMGCYIGKAVPVPPHGRLIDANELLQFHRVSVGIYFPDAYIPATAIKAAPTIIPAEEADCHTSDTVTGSQ